MISFKKAIAFLLALLMTLGILPSGTALAAENTSVTIKLAAIQGDVRIMVGETPFKTPKVDMRLMDGSSILTGEKSYASLEMDDSKFATVDQNSEVKIKKSGKTNEILISSGSVFFNVTKPLENEETMRVKTSNITMSVRGTIGVNIARTVYDEQGNPVSVSSETQIYEGVGVVTTIGGTAAAPGASATYEVRPGQSLITTTTLSTGTTTVTQNEIGTDGAGIPAVALEQMVASPELANRVSAATGLDVAQLPDALVQAQEAEQQEQQQTKEALTGAQNQFQAENQPQIAPAPAIPEEAIKSAQDQQGVGSGKDVTTPPPPTIPSGGGGGVAAKTVATIGNTRYTDIGKAFNELGSGQTLTVLEDCATTANITLPAGSLLVINNTIKLTINGSFTNRGLVTLGASATLSGYNFQTPEAPGMFHLGMGSRLVSVQGAVLRDKAGNPTAELMSSEADGWVIWKQSTGWQHALTGDALSTSTGITVPEKGVGYVPLGKTLTLQAGKQNRVDGTLVMDGWFTLANPLGDNALVLGASGKLLGSAAAAGFFREDGTTPIALPVTQGTYLAVSQNGTLIFKWYKETEPTIVATIGSTKYTDIGKAFKELGSGQMLTVLEDCATPENVSITLPAGSFLVINNAKRLTINGGFANRGLVTLGASATLSGYNFQTPEAPGMFHLGMGSRLVSVQGAVLRDKAGNPTAELMSNEADGWVIWKQNTGWQHALTGDALSTSTGITVPEKGVGYVPLGKTLALQAGKQNRVDGTLVMDGWFTLANPLGDNTLVVGADGRVLGSAAANGFFGTDGTTPLPLPIAAGSYIGVSRDGKVAFKLSQDEDQGGEQTETTVAQIGDLHYESVDEALATLESGEELVVYRSANLTEVQRIPESATLIIKSHEGVPAVLAVLEPVSLTNLGRIEVCEGAALRVLGALLNGQTNTNSSQVDVVGAGSTLEMSRASTFASNAFLRLRDGGRVTCDAAIFYDAAGENPVQEMTSAGSVIYLFPRITVGLQLPLRLEDIINQNPISVGAGSIAYVPPGEGITIRGKGNRVDGRLIMHGQMRYEALDAEITIAPGAIVSGYGAQMTFYDNDSGWLAPPIAEGTYLADDNVDGIGSPGFVKQSDGGEQTQTTVAQIGDLHYESIDKALAELKSGEELVVYRNASLTKDCAVPQNATVTLEGLEGVSAILTVPITLTNNGAIAITNRCTLEASGSLVNNGIISVDGLDANVVNADHITPSSNGSLWVSQGGHMIAGTAIFYDELGESAVEEVNPTYDETSDWYYLPLIDGGKGWQLTLRGEALSHPDRGLSVGEKTIGYVMLSEMLTVYPGHDNSVEGRLVVEGGMYYPEAGTKFIIANDAEVKGTGVQNMFYDQDGNALPTPIPAGTYIASDEAGGAERPGLVKQSDVVGPEPTPDPNSVARVGSDYYTTLHEAIAAAENVGDEVIVTKSCSLTEEAALESGVKLTIGADSKGTPVTVSLEATLTCDGVIELGLGGQLEGTERISRNGFYSVMSLRGGTASASTPVFTDKDGNGPVNEVTGEDDDYVYAAFSFEPSKWQCALKQDEFVTDGSMDVPQGSTAVIRTGETVILKEGGTNVVEGTLIILDDKDVHGVLTAAATEVPVVIGETGGIGCTGKNLIFYTLQQGGNAGSVEFFRFALKGSYLSRLADDGSGYIFEKMTTE